MHQAENKFDPTQEWDSVEQAAKAILAQPNPREALKQVVAANFDLHEFGFVSELVTEYASLEFAAEIDQQAQEKISVSVQSIEKPASKLVTIQLAARTRVEYCETVEVPANATQEQIDALVDCRYRAVEAVQYVSDPDYWERATCVAIPEDAGFEACKKATLTPSGEWVVEAIL
jgi:hypothetical protein